MYYLDEIELLDNLPKRSDVKLLAHDSDWFYLILKDDSRINLFKLFEDITAKEFYTMADNIINKFFN